jgi:hypothetical protein
MIFTNHPNNLPANIEKYHKIYNICPRKTYQLLESNYWDGIHAGYCKDNSPFDQMPRPIDGYPPQQILLQITFRPIRGSRCSNPCPPEMAPFIQYVVVDVD